MNYIESVGFAKDNVFTVYQLQMCDIPTKDTSINSLQYCE